MLLLHTSDWHLGAVDGERSMKEDQRFFIDQITRIIREEKADAVLLAGDVFDRSISNTDGIELYDYAMSEIVMKLHVPVIAVAGNHDSAERLASCRDLLKEAGLHVSGALEREPQKVSIGNTDVYLLPWFTEQKARALYPEHKDDIHSLQDAYQAVCDRIREDFVPGRRHIALSHSYIVNAETSVSDRAAEIGHAMSVGAEVFDGFDYVALGHIHKPQDIGGTIRYSGTPMPFSFGKEETQVKSVTLIDTETMERRIVPLPLLHRRITIEAPWEEILAADYPEDVRNGYVRIRVTDKFVDSLMMTRLEGLFPNRLSISGKSFEDENAGIRMTMEEFEELQEDPMKIFERFCTEAVSIEADDHLKELFDAAMAACEKEDGE